MAMPKRGTKRIVVSGSAYRYRGFLAHFEGYNDGEVIIELYDKPKQKVKAQFTWEKVSRALAKGNKKIGKCDTFAPYIVRQTILFALKQGWRPNEGGGIKDLGNLDDKIDFSELKLAL